MLAALGRQHHTQSSELPLMTQGRLWLLMEGSGLKF